MKSFLSRAKAGSLLWLFGGAVLFVIGILMTFVDVVQHPDEVSGRYDVYRYFGPINYFMDASLHGGQPPLWNPYLFCGMPHAANPQTGFFYPPNVLRSLLTFSPTPSATHYGYCIMMGLHLLLAALGVYLLTRAHGATRGGAMAAAVAFTFSALMIRRVCEYHFITTLGWLPLLLYLVKRGMDSTGVWRRLAPAVAGGLMLGAAILAGFLQIIAYIGLAVGVYAVGYRLLYPRGNKGTASLRGLLPWDAAGLVTMLVLAGLIGAALLLPAMELAGHTARQQGEAIRPYSNLLRQEPIKLIQDFLVYPGMKYEPEALRGSGVAALLFAIAGLLFFGRRDVALFAGLYVVLLDCSFGPPFPIASLLERILPFSVSAHSRAYDVALLPLSVLTGFGVDAVTRPLRSTRAGLIRTGVLAGLGIVFIVLLSRWTGPHRFLPVGQLVVLVPAGSLCVALFAGWVPVSHWFRAVLVLLLFGETLAWNEFYVPHLARRKSADAHVDVPPAFPLNNNRWVDAVSNRFLYSLLPQVNGYDPLHIERVRTVISGGERERGYHRLVTGEEPTAQNNRAYLFLKRRFWLARQYVPGPLPAKSKLFTSTTTVFLPEAEPPMPHTHMDAVTGSGVTDAVYVVKPAGGEPLPMEIPFEKGHARTLYFELPTHGIELPTGPAGCLHSVLRLSYTGTAMGRVEMDYRDRAGKRPSGFGAQFDVVPMHNQVRTLEVPLPDIPELLVVLRTAPRRTDGSLTITAAEVRCDRSDEDYLIKPVTQENNYVQVQVGPLPGARVLVFMDAWYPGWKAFVDGQPAPIMRANDAFKAVVVPAGDHQVEFAFMPTRVFAGVAISGGAAAGALVLLVMAAFGARRARKRASVSVSAPPLQTS